MYMVHGLFGGYKIQNEMNINAKIKVSHLASK